MMPPLEPRPTSVGSLGTPSDEGKDIGDPTLGMMGAAGRPRYAGSLGADSTEGKGYSAILCWGHGRRPPRAGTEGKNAVRRTAEEVPTPPIRRARMRMRWMKASCPELDAQTLIQGVVMSEILKRPNERKWGWR